MGDHDGKGHVRKCRGLGVDRDGGGGGRLSGSGEDRRLGMDENPAGIVGASRRCG